MVVSPRVRRGAGHPWQAGIQQADLDTGGRLSILCHCSVDRGWGWLIADEGQVGWGRVLCLQSERAGDQGAKQHGSKGGTDAERSG